jgi:hypothetical protein
MLFFLLDTQLAIVFSRPHRRAFDVCVYVCVFIAQSAVGTLNQSKKYDIEPEVIERQTAGASKITGSGRVPNMALIMQCY